MFERLFEKKPQGSPVESLPKLTEEQREDALSHIEALKHGGGVTLTPEEEAAHEETKRLKEERELGQLDQ